MCIRPKRTSFFPRSRRAARPSGDDLAHHAAGARAAERAVASLGPCRRPIRTSASGAALREIAILSGNVSTPTRVRTTHLLQDLHARACFPSGASSRSASRCAGNFARSGHARSPNLRTGVFRTQFQRRVASDRRARRRAHSLDPAVQPPPRGPGPFAGMPCVRGRGPSVRGGGGGGVRDNIWRARFLVCWHRRVFRARRRATGSGR